MAEKSSAVAPAQRNALSRRETAWSASPFSMLEQFANEIETVFDDFGLGRSWLAPRWGQLTARRMGRSGMEHWIPEVEVHQQNDELVVRADLPGMKKEDVTVDVTDRDVTISGERRQEQQTERGGFYQSERTYGSFCRTIPLPEGAIADQAKASFKDGVLEVRLPAPPAQVTRGRRIEVKDK